MAWALALITVVVAGSEACVVNPSASQFSSQDSCPPYLLADQSSVPTNKIDVIDPSVPSASFDVDIPVRSCNLTKTFAGRVFLDGQTNGIFLEFGIDPTSGDTRHARFSVPIGGTLSAGCHRIELYVSTGGFALGDPRAPATPGDLSYAAWFVYVHKSGDPDLPISECNR